jgi:valyl-tRNA synthetase
MDFVWDNFCDWYIELSKPALYGEDEDRKSDALAVLCYVLENALKLLHPFIPFVTEEIYANLPNTSGSIMTAEFPRYNAKAAYKKEAKAFEGVMGIIKAVRAMKKDADCPPSKKVELYVVTESKRLIQVNKDCIVKLSGASGLHFVDAASDVEGKTVSAVTEIAQIYVLLGELVDIEKEKARLSAEIERIDAEIARAEGKLNNESFVSKAPAKLVDAEKEKLAKYQDMKAKCVAQLESL